MIKLIPASEKYLDQLVSLLGSTSYYEAIAQCNTLGLDATTYIRDYRVKTTLPLTTIAVSNDDIVLGMITCAR